MISKIKAGIVNVKTQTPEVMSQKFKARRKKSQVRSQRPDFRIYIIYVLISVFCFSAGGARLPVGQGPRLMSGLFSVLCLTAHAEEINKVVARVNSEIITAKDLNDYCRLISYRFSEEDKEFNCQDEEAKKATLARLIEDKLILDKAKKEEIDVPSAWVEAKVKEMISAAPSRSQFERSLIEKGLNMTVLRERIKEQFLVRQVIDKYVRAFVSVPPQDISRYYRSHPDEFGLIDKYVVWIGKSLDQHVLETVAQGIKEKGIEEAEKEHNDILIRIEAGLDELIGGISSALQRMEEGQCRIEEIDNVKYLIYLDKIIPRAEISLDTVKEKIHSFLGQQKFNRRFNEWLGRLKEEGFIKVYP